MSTSFSPIRPGACAALIVAVFAFMSVPAAHACACCSDRGYRADAEAAIEDSTRVQMERMRFATDATMATEMGDDEPAGLPSGMSSSYALVMTRENGVLTFALRDPVGRTGSLRFAMPNRYWVFVVDPFGDTKDEGLGPSLYKEWRLTADVTGEGLFRNATPPGKKVTLIFHGRGRGCTEAEDFTHWSLLLHGKGGRITFYGALETP